MGKNFRIFSIETSCDDTSTAIIDNNFHVYSNLISSQMQHSEFGGVVPELASRLHLKNILWLTRMTLKKAEMQLSDISAFAVSINPGLIGSLLVGVSFAKSLAYACQKPLIAVNHMLGHLHAIKLDYPDIEPPYLALIVSGGHTELVYFNKELDFQIIGKTRDDAAGEAFDKAAKLMGLDYPGGPLLAELSTDGDKGYTNFPRGLDCKDNYDFSFSGLKTAVRNFLRKIDKAELKIHKADIAASIQAAIVDIMIKKTVSYAKKKDIKKIVVAGGVAANNYLRQELNDIVRKNGIDVYFPSLGFCMDNAAMIGAAAVNKYKRGEFAELQLNAFSTKGVRYI